MEKLTINLSLLNQAIKFVFHGSKSIRAWARFSIVFRLLRTRLGNRGKSASTLGEQLVLVNAVLDIPRKELGNIAEFGCYKGICSVALSIAAKHSGRRLLVFDSFEGLPNSEIKVHNITSGKLLDYRKGLYAGTLNEVRAVIAKYGEIDCCDFVEGFFCDTLPLRPKSEQYALIFEDADLVESVKDVLQHAWPKLNDGGFFFCHEARDLEVVKLFYDDRIWNILNKSESPGLVGGGIGLPIDCGSETPLRNEDFRGSCMGYTIKRRGPRPNGT